TLIDQDVGRNPQIAQLTCDSHVPDHRPADEADLAAGGRGGVQYLLDPVDVRGEAGDDHPVLGGTEHVVDHRADVALAGDEPRYLGIGGVRHQQVDALAAEPGEPGQVGQPAVHRQLVHLEVAGAQHQAG